MWIRFTLLILAGAAAIDIPNLNGSAQADRVYSLPGTPTFTSAIYSGYLAVGDTGKALHYYFAQSQNDPYTDPVVIWTNGGPGCSSMLALIQEHGPFYMEDYGDKIYTNPYSWNLEANMLYVEQPAGVGYSLVKNDSQLNTNDTISSEDFLLAVVSFYKKFSPFKMNELWVTGESYGGIYVPWLAKRILEYNQNQTDMSMKMNLKGIMVGNGAAKWEYDTNMAYLNMSYYHAMYSPAMRSNFTTNNCKLYTDWIPDPPQDPACNEFQKKFEKLTQHINIYDIYRECYVPPEGVNHVYTQFVDGQPKEYRAHMTSLDYTPWRFLGPDFSSKQEEKQILKDDSGLTCSYDQGMAHFMNDPEVRTALHIPTEAPGWESCSQQMNYTNAANGSHWIYPELKQAGLKILFFSGDTDGAVATLGSLHWIRELGWSTIQEWSPWKVDGEVAGYKWILDGMTFTTIHGVGHMAPQWARKQVFTMFHLFLNDAFN